jgi:hypothetical protein
LIYKKKKLTVAFEWRKELGSSMGRLLAWLGISRQYFLQNYSKMKRKF